MIQITTEDGACFSGETPDEVVTSMARACWHSPSTNKYMQEVASRCTSWDGAGVRISHSAEFLADLIRAGVVVRAAVGGVEASAGDIERMCQVVS